MNYKSEQFRRSCSFLFFNGKYKERICDMRIDKYLKVSRIIKRRSVANEACDSGRVSVNGKPVKASYDVKAGDVLEITLGERVMRYEVCEVLEHALKADAQNMYKVL